MNHSACHGFRAANSARRVLLKVGGLGMLGLNMPGLLRAAEQASAPAARAKRVIFLFQFGGPSHIDMFDRKPRAPEDVRSPLADEQTSLPGLTLCEGLPKLAKWMDRVTIIRSVTHKMKNHNSAAYYALTGHAPPSDDQRLRDSLSLYPAYGSVVDRLAPVAEGSPTSVSYPYTIRDGSITPGQHASFLGKRHDPFFFTADPNSDDFRLPELTLPKNLTVDRLQARRELLRIVDQQARLLDFAQSAQGFDAYYEKALAMLTTGKIRTAFDLSAEPEPVREQYGRTTYGQGCLLARRLVEAGVKFVTVYFSPNIGGQKTDSGGWDTHGFNKTRMYPIIKEYHLPITDHTLPTLLDDLETRGLLDETLVVWMGEFGRTPKINKESSRDHWPRCYSVLLAGGGVKQGFIYGASDAQAMYPDEYPVRPDDLAATIFHLLGVNPSAEVYDTADRPLVIAEGSPISAVLA